MALYKNIKTWSDLEKEQVNKKMFGGFDINSSSFAAIQPTFKRNNESSAKENSSIIHFTTDGNIIMNGQLFGGGAVDLNLAYASYYGLPDVKYDITVSTLIGHFANNRNENQSPFCFYRYDGSSVAPAAVIYTRSGVDHGIFEFATGQTKGSPVPRISFSVYNQYWQTSEPLVLFNHINEVTPGPNAGIRYELKFDNIVQSYFDIPFVENPKYDHGLMPYEQYLAVSKGIMNNLTSTIEAGKLKLKYQLLQGSTGPYKELTILNQADSTHDGYITQEQFQHLDKTYSDVIHIQDNVVPKVDRLATEIPAQINGINFRLNDCIGSVIILNIDIQEQGAVIKQTLVPGLATVKDKVRGLDSTVSSIAISLTNVQAKADKSYTTATDAKTKADNAYTIAYTSMNSAYSYMSSAYSYMKSAETAKTAAIAASDSSKKSANAAAASANTASGHASSASSSANSALASKTAAETSKTAAEAAKNTAIAASDSSKKSANAAATSANTASGHASSASSSANSALASKTAAEAAKNTAVSAKDSSVRSSNSAKVYLDCTKKIRDDVNTGLTAVNNNIKTVSDLVGPRDKLDKPNLSITEYIGSEINWSASYWNKSIASAIGNPSYIDDLGDQSLTYYIGRVLNRYNDIDWRNVDNVWEVIGSLPYQDYPSVSDAIKDIHSVLKFGVIGDLKMDPVGSGYDIYYDIYYNKNFGDPDFVRPTVGTSPTPSETTTTTYPTTLYPTTTAAQKQSQNALTRMSGPGTGTIREVLSEVHGTSKSVTANDRSAHPEYTYDPSVVRRKLRIPWYGEDPTRPGVVSEHDVELTVNKVNNISDSWHDWPIGSILGTRWPVSQQHGPVDNDFIALGDTISQKLYKLTEKLVYIDSTLESVSELAYIRKSTDRSKGILEYAQRSIGNQDPSSKYIDLPDADQQYHGLMSPDHYKQLMHSGYDIKAKFDEYNNFYFRLLTHGDIIGGATPTAQMIPMATSDNPGIMAPFHVQTISTLRSDYETINKKLSSFVPYSELPTYLNDKQDKIAKYINDIGVSYDSNGLWITCTYAGSGGSNTLTANFPHATSSRCGIVNPDLYNRIYNTYTKAEVNSYLSGKQNAGNYLTKVEASVQNGKQKLWFYHSGGSQGVAVNITDASTTQNGFMTANHVTTLNNLVSKTSNMFSKSEVTDLVNKETVSLADLLRGNMVALYFHGLDKNGVYNLTPSSTTKAGQVWFGRIRDAMGVRWSFYVWADGAAYADGNNLTIPSQYENPGTLGNYLNHSLFTDGKSLYTWGKNKGNLIKIGEVPDTYLKTISESHGTDNVFINYTNSAGADTHIVIPTVSPSNAGIMSSGMYKKLENVYSKDSTYSASKIDSLVSNCLKTSILQEIYKQANSVHCNGDGSSSFIPSNCFIYNIRGKQDTTIELQYSDRMNSDHVDIYCTMPIGHATIKSAKPIYYRDQYSDSRKSTKSLTMGFGSACRLMYYSDSSEAYWTMFNLIADPTVGPM